MKYMFILLILLSFVSIAIAEENSTDFNESIEEFENYIEDEEQYIEESENIYENTTEPSLIYETDIDGNTVIFSTEGKVIGVFPPTPVEPTTILSEPQSLLPYTNTTPSITNSTIYITINTQETPQPNILSVLNYVVSILR